MSSYFSTGALNCYIQNALQWFFFSPLERTISFFEEAEIFHGEKKSDEQTPNKVTFL